MKQFKILPLLLASLALSISSAHATTYYWVGGNGDSVNDMTNWHTANPVACNDGGGNSAEVPGSNDTVIFDADCDSNAVIDLSWTLQKIQMDSGYTGTITQNNGFTITLNPGAGDAFAIAGGTFAGGDSAIDINDGNFNQSGGSFTNSSGNMTIERNFTVSAGTFTNAGKTVTFNGTSDTTAITCTGALEGTVIFGKTGGNLGYTSTISANCNISAGATPTWGIHTLTNNGTITVDSGTWTINGDAYALTNAGTITHNGSGWDINGTSLTNNLGATITYAGTAITIERSFTQNGTFDLTGITVTFDGTNNTVLTCTGALGGTVDFGKTGGNIGYTATISANCSISAGAAPSWSIHSLTNNGTITVDSGTWTVAGDGPGLINAGTITHNGSGWDINNVSLTNNLGATITYAGTTITIELSFTQNGTFDLTGKTVTFDGTYSTVLTCTGALGGKVAFGKTGGNVGYTATISANCSISAGATPSWTIHTLTNNGTITVDSGTWTVGGDGPGLINAGTITHNGSGWDINNISLTNNLGATITYASTAVTIEKSFTQNGTFDLTGKTVTFDGTSHASSLTCGVTIGGVIVNKAGGSPGNTTLASNCTLSGDFTRTAGPLANPGAAYTLTVQGNVSISKTNLTGGANFTLELGGGNNQNVALNAGDFDGVLQVNKSGGIADFTTNWTNSARNLIIVEGTLDLNNKSLTLNGGGTLTVQDGGNFRLLHSETTPTPTLNAGSTVTYDGGGSYTLNNWSYHHLTLNGAGTWTLANAVNTAGNITITSGTLDVSAAGCAGVSCGINLEGNWDNDGTFTARTGTVTLDGTNQSVSGVTTFYNLAKAESNDNSTNETLTFEAGVKQTITNTWTLDGRDADDQILLVSSNPSTRWQVDPQVTRTLDFITVTDSNNTNATAVNCSNNCTDGGAGGTNLNWNFDTTAPTIQTLSPADNATGIAVASNLVITFSEAVDVESGNITIFKASDDSVVEAIDVTGGLVTGTGTTTITVNPTSNLTTETAYYIQIAATAFDDPSSNSFAGILNNTTWNFTTVDVTAPTIQTLSPADNATDVAIDSNLVLTFTEAVDVEIGNITIFKSSDNSVVEVIDVTGGLVTGTGTTIITINPTSDLLEATDYYIQIDATAFDDSQSNSFAGIADLTTWTLSTTVPLNPDLFEITVELFGGTRAKPGDVLQGALTATNATSTTITNTDIVFELPSGLSFLSGSATPDNNSTLTNPRQEGSNYKLTIPSIGPGITSKIGFKLIVGSNAQPGEVMNFRVSTSNA